MSQTFPSRKIYICGILFSLPEIAERQHTLVDVLAKVKILQAPNSVSITLCHFLSSKLVYKNMYHSLSVI